MRDLYNLFEKPKDRWPSIAPYQPGFPDKVREWSFGEVKKPETINYRTFKPERDGPLLREDLRPGQGLRVQHAASTSA